jgi:phytoene synthase
MNTRATLADFRACRTIIANGSKSFHAASLLLPAVLREPAFALYAFCRVSDDAVDAEGGQTAALHRLRARLDAAYAGTPFASPVDRALSDTVRRFHIPKVVFDALLEGFAWDVEGRRYRTLSDIYAYSARVAGSVGVMMSCMMGVRTPDLLARACDLGVAMQLTNIARDVGEDARNGRLYLPRQWLEEGGLNIAAWMAHPTPDPRVCAAVLRLLDAADVLYARADAGIAGLPASCRPAIRAARLIYADIGVRVRALGGDGVTRRAVTPASRKVVLAARAFTGPGRLAHAALRAPPLAQTRYLVAAAAVPAPSAAATVRRATLGPLRQADESWGRVFELFQDLENRRRYGPVHD